jgi:TIR domain
MNYSFFFSYASEDDRSSDGRVRKFYDRLSNNLTIAHGRVDEPFFAPRGIQAGQNWKDSLRTALNSSGILICLQSPLYFGSKICGQELETFLQRRKLYKKAGGNPPDCVIPILWHPLIDIPKALPNDFQGKKPSSDLTPFREDGLYEAILTDEAEGKKRIDLYALRLARRISDLIRKNTGERALPPLPFVPDLDVIPSAFDFPEWPLTDIDEEKGTGPASITLVYPTGLPPEGLPFSPPPPNAIIWAAALAKSQEWIFQGVGFDSVDDLAVKLAKVKWAQEKKSPVVLMLTETLLQDRELLNHFEQIEKKGLATIVLSTASGSQLPSDFPATLKAALNPTLATRDRFDDLLLNKVGKLRAAIMTEPTTNVPGTMPAF